MKWLVIGWLTVLFSGIGYLFWYNEWRYSLPTPVPDHYQSIPVGSTINIDRIRATNKPLFLHFFNPACPCSKFNVEHFKWLVNNYSEYVSFAVVVLSKDKFTSKEIQEDFGLSIPVLFDESIAASCGVYSTPQAVLIDSENKLYYRGNYNKSRYCTAKKSNYAQMAIDSLLINKKKPVFTAAALKSYGCSLPVINR